MTTRRNILKGGAGLAAILATGKAPAYLVKSMVAAQTAPAVIVRSMVAARNGIAAAKRGGGWANPYVTDGLIAMWDGEWNAGSGKHDPNATKWADISGNSRDAVLSGTYSWGENYWHVESVSGRGIATWPAQNLGSNQSIEFVIDPIDTTRYGRIIAEAQSIASPIFRSNNYLWVYGYGYDSGLAVTDYNIGDKHLHQIVHPSSGTMRYYIDGNLVWEHDRYADSTGDTNGYFANRSSYDRGIDADYFTMRRYNRVLSSEELSANYAVDKDRFNLP